MTKPTHTYTMRTSTGKASTYATESIGLEAMTDYCKYLNAKTPNLSHRVHQYSTNKNLTAPTVLLAEVKAHRQAPAATLIKVEIQQ